MRSYKNEICNFTQINPYKHTTCIPRWDDVETVVFTSFQHGIDVVCSIATSCPNLVIATETDMVYTKSRNITMIASSVYIKLNIFLNIAAADKELKYFLKFMWLYYDDVSNYSRANSVFNNKTAQIWLSSSTVSGEMNSPSVFAELYYKNNLQSASHVSGRTTRLWPRYYSLHFKHINTLFTEICETLSGKNPYFMKSIFTKET